MFQLTPGQPLAAGVRAVAGRLLDDALASIDQLDGRHEVVHEVRRGCKQVRALVRLVRDGVPDTYRDVNTSLRDTARLLSRSRDAAAAVETHDALVAALGQDASAPFGAVRDLLVERRDGEVLAAIGARLPDVRDRLAAVRDGVDGWHLPDGAGIEVLRAGYARTYGRAHTRLADAAADSSAHVWHQWRKRAKYHRHHTELLEEAWPPVMRQREGLLHELTDLLGDDHDLAELRTALIDDRVVDVDQATLDGYVEVIDRRSATLRRDALPLGARLFAAAPDGHADLVTTWWRLAAEGTR